MSYKEFVGDDPGYKQWIATNPDGFVVNTEKSKRPKYVSFTVQIADTWPSLKVGSMMEVLQNVAT